MKIFKVLKSTYRFNKIKIITLALPLEYKVLKKMKHDVD